MVTHGVIGIIEPRKVYDVGAHGIVELDKKLAKKKNTKPTFKGVTVTRPPCVQYDAPRLLCVNHVIDTFLFLSFPSDCFNSPITGARN